MADLTKITREIDFKADTSGLDKVSAAADKAAASTTKLSTATSSLATATEKSDKSVLSVAAQLDRLSKAADPAQKALAAVERQQRLIDAATKQGQPVRQEWTNALAILKGRHEELTKATHEHATAQGLSRVQMMESMHVAKSLADSIIAGASPMRALAVEGGRIAQIFAEGNGGVGGTLKAMGATVGRLATGWLGLGVAVAAGAGLAAAAIIRFQSQQDRLALSLNGAGRYAGVNVGGLAGIANSAGARNPYLGQGGATSLAAALASTGHISAGIMPGILDMAPGYARGTGQDLTKAGEELAKAFSDPGKGAEMLNEKLGFLDDATKRSIESLERQGDVLGAQQVLLAKAANEAARMTDTTWSLAKAWDGFTSALGRGANAFAEGLHRTLDPTLADKLDAALQLRAGSARGPRGGAQSGAGADAAISALRYGVAYQQYGETRLAGAGAADKATNDLSIKIGDAVRHALPEVDKTQELTDTLKLLDDALRNPEVIAKTQGGLGALTLADTRTRNLRANSDPLQRIQQDASLSAQSAQAQTGAERTLIEARRAELEVMRSTGDATQAAAKSLGVWNEEIAKSNKEAEDAARTASRDLSTSLMRPFERGAQEIRYRFEDSRRNSVTGPVSALDGNFTALDPFGDLGSASSAFGGKSGARITRAEDILRIGRARSLEPAVMDDHFAVPIGSHAPAASRFAPGDIVVAGGGARRGGAIASTSAATYGGAEADTLGAYYNTQTLAKLQTAGDELDRQNKLLAVRAANFGKSNEALQKAVATQELWNSLQLDDKAIQELGPARIAKITDTINQQSDAIVKNQKQQQQVDQLSGAANWFQSTGNSVVSDFGQSFGDLFNANPRNLVSQLKIGDQAKYYAGQLSGGQVKSKIFQMQAGNFLRNLLFQQGISMVQKGLLGSGQYGTPGYQSGLFGGVFNSILGGAGGLFGLGGGGGGSVSGLNSLLGGSGNPWGYALGGVMTSAGPVPLRKYAGGGVADSPQMAVFG